MRDAEHPEFETVITWNVGERSFRLTANSTSATFVNADGQVLEMAACDWSHLVTALERVGFMPARNRHKDRPPNAGQPWTPDEDVKLNSYYKRGASLSETANDFGRTAGAIKSRLEKLGLIAP